VAYAIENARYQWEEGERRLRQTDEPDRSHLERAVMAVEDGIRRRLGGSFSIRELVALYGEGTDWADQIAQKRSAGLDTGLVVDAAFASYARDAFDFAGGREQTPPEDRDRIPDFGD
jgi:hypothetical protein